MDMEISTFQNEQPSPPTKRIIADAIRVVSTKRIFPYSNGSKETSQVEYLAQMLWDAATEGVIVFSDGTELVISDDIKGWIDIVKFLATHLDGAVNNSTQFNGINVFKVYKNIDPDMV